jgi:hypothetical protein
LPTNRYPSPNARKRQKIWKNKQSANFQCNVKKSELSLVKSNDTFLNYLIIILAEYQYVRRKVVNKCTFLNCCGLSSKEEVIGKTGVELELITKIDNTKQIALNNTFVNKIKTKLEKLCVSNTEEIHLHYSGFGGYYRTQKKPKSKKNECAAYFLKTRNSSDAKLSLEYRTYFENGKRKRAAELVIANTELAFQNEQKKSVQQS